MMRTLLLALSTRPAIGRWMERVPATRGLVRRFVAGTTADDALAVLERLNARGLMGAVTYLGENVTTPADAERATQTYLHLLDEIKRRNLNALPSLKLTHLGLDLGEPLCVANLSAVLERARAMGTRVWVDMESSVYTDRTLALYARLRPMHPHLACVVQAYLRRTPADLDRLIDLGATIRLCKGAYREPPAIAYPDKADVRAYPRSRPRPTAGRGTVRDPDAVWHPARAAGCAHGRWPARARAGSVRRGLVRLLHAAAGRAARQRAFLPEAPRADLRP